MTLPDLLAEAARRAAQRFASPNRVTRDIEVVEFQGRKYYVHVWTEDNTNGED